MTIPQRHDGDTPGGPSGAGSLGLASPLHARPIPRDSAARRQDRTDEESDNPANDAGGKTKFDHRKKSGRRKDVEPNNQPNDGSDRACRSRSKYCPPYGLRLGA